MLFWIVGTGLTTITWLSLSDLGLAREIWHPSPQLKLVQAPTNSTEKVIFVNPAVDGNGDGSESSPFKTITQALQVAEPNTTIALAAGIYSTQSGETFPLKLKPNVTLQGESKTRGSNIIIKGGDIFISPTFARQNVAILGADRASLIGVTVTNPNPRGYALWIESSSPTVSDNTFTGSAHDGISITGKGAPVIRNNYFYKNGANGITIYGTSQPQVRENVFEQTGFGINIAQKAAPLIVGNRIINNRSGVVAQANSKPVLRDNLIEGNTEDGLVAIALSQPDLGTKSQPGGNQFRQNGRYDINSSAAKGAIASVGNQLTSDRLAGNIDLARTSTPIVAANQPPTSRGVDNSQEIPSVPTIEARSEEQARGDNNQENLALVPTLEEGTRTENQPDPNPAPASTAIAPIDIPVPLPESTQQVKPSNEPPQKPEKLSFVPITELQERINVPPARDDKPSVAIATPPPAAKPIAPPRIKSDSFTAGLPVLKPAPINPSELLPVPNANIPLNNVAATRVATADSPPHPQTNLATAIGLRYRVVVEAENEDTQAKVRSLIPGAFRLFANGRVLMQAGTYSDRDRADEMLQLLTDNGLKAKVEEIN